MKRITIGILVIISLTHSLAQSTNLKNYPTTSNTGGDTTKFYPVPKWKLDRLLQAYFYTLPSCDSTVIAYQNALQKADSTINSANKVILLRTEQRDLKVIESDLWQKRFENATEIKHQEIRQARKKGFKSGAAVTGIFSIVLIVILL